MSDFHATMEILQFRLGARKKLSSRPLHSHCFPTDTIELVIVVSVVVTVIYFMTMFVTHCPQRKLPCLRTTPRCRACCHDHLHIDAPHTGPAASSNTGSSHTTHVMTTLIAGQRHFRVKCSLLYRPWIQLRAQFPPTMASTRPRLLVLRCCLLSDHQNY